MTLAVRFARSREEFDRAAARFDWLVERTKRLPELPFRADCGHVSVAEFLSPCGEDFTSVLRSLSMHFGDDEILVMVVDQPVDYYEENYGGFLPQFSVRPQNLDEGYAAGLAFRPAGDITGRILESDVIAVTGSSGRWAVWGEREWEVALLWSLETGPWLKGDVPLTGPIDALKNFAGYGSWGTGWDDDEVREFAANVDRFRTPR